MQYYNIELIEEYDKVNFYSIHLSDSELSELEDFFEKFPVGCEYDEDIDVIISWLDRIAERGALERHMGRERDPCSLCQIVDRHQSFYLFKNQGWYNCIG